MMATRQHRQQVYTKDRNFDPPGPRLSTIAPPVLHGDNPDYYYDQHGMLRTRDNSTFWSEMEIFGNVRALSPVLFSMTHLTSLYVNNNKLSRIPADISKLQNLEVLELSNNVIRQLPPEIGDMPNLRELHLNNNALRTLPCELGRLFQLRQLSLKNNPITQELLVHYNEPNGTEKLLLYLLDNIQFNHSSPPPRPWIPLREPSHSSAIANSFTVMCYNVLSPFYANRKLYGYCPNWALDWSNRREHILMEIKHFEADILAMQEVVTEQFFSFFLPQLEQVGYDGIFAPKARAKTMGTTDKGNVDGCAIFFKASKFRLIRHKVYEFGQLAMAYSECPDMLNRVMVRDNIGMVILLQTKEKVFVNVDGQPVQMVANQPLIVSTAHFHWDPTFCDVKLVQSMLLLNELRKFAEDALDLFNLIPEGGQPDLSLIPTILCGDLNSLPESGVVEFLTKGSVSGDHEDFLGSDYQDCLHKLCPANKDAKNEYRHVFDFVKAYTDELPFTNYTHKFSGVIDYVFCARQTFSVLGVLGPIDLNWLTANKIPGCPHMGIPSDHFPLVVEMELIPKVAIKHAVPSEVNPNEKLVVGSNGYNAGRSFSNGSPYRR